MLKSPLRDLDLEARYSAACRFLKTSMKKAGASGLVLGLSGGLDSSVALKACADAVGSASVLGVILPERGVTLPGDVRDASKLAATLGVPVVEVALDRVLEAFTSLRKDRTAMGNLKARLRMAVLYYYANVQSRLVVGTGDRSEIYLGYFTKFGDGGVDLLPLGGLYKTELRVLAMRLGIPPSIVAKPSSPRLWAGQTAEGELGISYELADKVLVALLDRGFTPAQAKRELALGREVDLVAARLRASSHKREMPPICQ